MEKAIRVLYIEDDEGTAYLIRQYLEQYGCIVTVAYDGQSGLAQYQSQAFDVVLVDHILPDITGVDIIRQLQSMNDLPPAIIMVTGSGNEQVAVEAMKAGASDYIVKDVHGVHHLLLMQVIYEALNKQDLRRNQQRLLEEQVQLIADLQAFSYAVAHDLKQPLAVFSTSLSLLERYIKAQEQQHIERKIAQLQETIGKMNSTINSLIMLAHVREMENLEFEPIDMVQLVQNVCQRLDNMIESYHAVVTIPATLPTALGYLPWVEHIWINYLSNAIKYGGTPPHIEIGATLQDDGTIYYWVKDNGEGLTPDEQKKLFLPFSRLKERRAEGHGLGLVIVNMIVRKLGGEVIVASSPGNGSTFGFTLRKKD